MTYPLSGDIPQLSDMFFGNDEIEDRQRLWKQRHDDIMSRVAGVVGDVPDASDRERIKVDVVSERTLASGVVMRSIVYASHLGDPVPAWLLVPKHASSAARLPAVMALHQTVACGKDEVAGVAGDPELAYGLELAERGFAVLAPDVPSAGARIFPGRAPYQTSPFYEQHAEWSMIGKMATDHKYGVSLLSQLDFVDADRIAAIGHSLGGYNAYFLSAFDRRIKAVVSSCGFCTFAGDPRPYRWAVRNGSFTHMPQITDYLIRSAIPFEFNEIIALSCPRPFFNWSTQNDEIFPHWAPIGKALDSVYRLYRELNAGDRFTSLLGTGEHSFPRAIRRMAYDWLEQHV